MVHWEVIIFKCSTNSPKLSNLGCWSRQKTGSIVLKECKEAGQRWPTLRAGSACCLATRYHATRLLSWRTSAQLCTYSAFAAQVAMYRYRLIMTPIPPTFPITTTLKWQTTLPILMQNHSGWWKGTAWRSPPFQPTQPLGSWSPPAPLQQWDIKQVEQQQRWKEL